jgi:hypothetical protein
MTTADLAPLPNPTKPVAFDNIDPFATPVFHPVNSPTYPAPCAHPTSRQWTEANEGQYTMHEAANIPHKTGSMSSSGGSSTLTKMSSIDLEKASLAREQNRQSRRSSPGSYTDPEKAAYKAHSLRGQRSPRRSGQSHSQEYAASMAYSDAESESDQVLRLQEAKALNILLFLSGPVVALSFLNFAWTLISLLITTLSQPVRLCAKRITFGQQLSSLLGPTLNLQLKSIYTPLPPYANEDVAFHPTMLTVVHLVSPLLSIGLALAAWVVAVYWALAGIVGDPAGLDKRDDGKETVLGLRGCWENLLLQGINLE